MKKNEKIGIILGSFVMLVGIIAYLIYRDEKTFNERINQFKETVRAFFAKKDP